MVEVTGITAGIGNACTIYCSSGTAIEAEVVGFRDERIMLMPVGATRGIAPGDAVLSRHAPPSLPVDDHLLGRVVNALGQAMDGRPLKPQGPTCPLYGQRLNPFSRHLIDTPMELGVKALDGCLPMGWGQRMGIFAGAGVGKSSLMGMLARNSDAEVNVIALVGERGREVREFLDLALGEEALKRSVVVVSTSDTPPVLRVRAALTATTIAEQFRSRGRRVLLMMDSLTRFAQAQREIGLMLGEPPTTKGFTPSCFSAIADLLERAGPGEEGGGSMSALYTVLVEGDDLAADPVADAAMAILDGHIVLERRLAERGHYPAINILRSISRLEGQIASEEQRMAARALRKDLALYEEMEEMITMGAYEQGSNPQLDAVIGRMDRIRAFLQQRPEEKVARMDAVEQLLRLHAGAQGTVRRP
ncbi:MAG: FliI/YscN family ATPase [Zetaproteobacteria bacterium]|nr:MAG: FliI/YscN family ATPase [Zetaproteobacteria bacterium]